MLPNLENTENIKIENYGQQLNEERKDIMTQSINYNTDLNSVLKEGNAEGATVLPSRDILKILYLYKVIQRCYTKSNTN